VVCCSCVRKFSDPMYLVDSVFSVMKKSDEYENQQHDADTDVATCTLKSHVRDYHALSVTVKCKTSRRFGLGEFETTPRGPNRVAACRERLCSRNNIAVAVVFMV